jgi:hypothetical protein
MRSGRAERQKHEVILPADANFPSDASFVFSRTIYHLNDFGDVLIAPIDKLFEKAAVAKHFCLIGRLSSVNLSQPGVVRWVRGRF